MSGENHGRARILHLPSVSAERPWSFLQAHINNHLPDYPICGSSADVQEESLTARHYACLVQNYTTKARVLTALEIMRNARSTSLSRDLDWYLQLLRRPIIKIAWLLSLPQAQFMEHWATSVHRHQLTFYLWEAGRAPEV